MLLQNSREKKRVGRMRVKFVLPCQAIIANYFSK
jgi:hypothetical protein